MKSLPQALFLEVGKNLMNFRQLMSAAFHTTFSDLVRLRKDNEFEVMENKWN